MELSNSRVLSTISPAAPFDIVVLAASLGGPGAIRTIVEALPAGFPAAVVVVQHRTLAAQDVTVGVLTRRTQAPVALAHQGDRPRAGRIYVAPADVGLMVTENGCFAYDPTPLRPGHGADVLLTSVAEHVGSRAIAVILSGANDDGAAGVVAIKRRGGRVLAQDRATSRSYTMPAAAIATGCVDFVLPVERMVPALITLTMVPGAADLFRVPLPPWARLVS